MVSRLGLFWGLRGPIGVKCSEHGSFPGSSVRLPAPSSRVGTAVLPPQRTRIQSGIYARRDILTHPTSHCELVPNTFTLQRWAWGPFPVATFLSLSILPAVGLPGGRVLFACKRHHLLVRVFVLLRMAHFFNYSHKHWHHLKMEKSISLSTYKEVHSPSWLPGSTFPVPR